MLVVLQLKGFLLKKTADSFSSEGSTSVFNLLPASTSAKMTTEELEMVTVLLCFIVIYLLYCLVFFSHHRKPLAETK